MLDRVQELATRAILSRYRSIAAQQGCAPSPNMSDAKIMEIYQRVGTAFQTAATQRGEHIPAGNINFIIWKFFQVYEIEGPQMFESHLEYEVQKYLQSGLQSDYQQEINLL